MWRILLAVGVLMLVVGTIFSGQSPIAAIRDASQSDSSSKDVVTNAASDNLSNQNEPQLITEQVATSTSRPTATARPTFTRIPTATVPPTVTPLPKQLRFYRKSLDDDARCVSMQIRGIKVENWTFRINGTSRVATFDGGGNARICGLRRGQEFLFTVFNTRNIAVTGGIDIPSKGGAIMIADWN